MTKTKRKGMTLKEARRLLEGWVVYARATAYGDKSHRWIATCGKKDKTGGASQVGSTAIAIGWGQTRGEAVAMAVASGLEYERLNAPEPAPKRTKSHAGSIDRHTAPGRVYRILKDYHETWAMGICRKEWMDTWTLTKRAKTVAVSTRVSEVNAQLRARGGTERIEHKQVGQGHFYRLVVEK